MEEKELPITQLICHAKRFVRFWQEEGVLKGQELENAVLDSDYTKAIQIAFEILRPHKLFELFAEISRGRKSDMQITNLAHESSSIKTRVRIEGGIPLVELLEFFDRKGYFDHHTWAEQAQDTHNQVGIAHDGGIEPLLMLLESKNGSIQDNSVFALYGVVDNEDDITNFTKGGGVQ